jgi:hypothetical protein
MPEECSAKCPLADLELLRGHTGIDSGDAELLEAIRSFAAWFYAPGENAEPEIRYAAELYVRGDHDGTCVPKTLLFAHYKAGQFREQPLLSEAAEAALRGERVASWPAGEPAVGQTWRELFAGYSRRYE